MPIYSIMGFYIASIEPELGFLGPFGVSYPALSHKKSALDVKISKSADDFKSSLVFCDPDLPPNFHPATIRVSVFNTPKGVD